MRFAIVQGTRPEIIKNYTVVKALQDAGIAHDVLHTNQHHHALMRDNIYDDMGYQPTHIMAGQHRIGSTIDWLQSRFAAQKTTHVIVNGDTAASLEGAIAALYLDIPVSHIEAGLRSYDTQMLEERNRIMVDSMATLLFAYTDFERKALASRKDIRGDVLVEGNTTVDLIHDFRDRISAAPIWGDGDSAYAYVTLHRRELTDSPVRLQSVLRALQVIADELCPIVFPIHPRTLDAVNRYGLEHELRGLHVMDPHTTFECLSMQANASVVLTDSGCIQEEAYMLGTPCVTVRENTERHLTIKHGANQLCGFDPDTIFALCQSALAATGGRWPEIYGLPGVGERIVKRIKWHHTNASSGRPLGSNAATLRSPGEIVA